MSIIGDKEDLIVAALQDSVLLENVKTNNIFPFAGEAIEALESKVPDFPSIIVVFRDRISREEANNDGAAVTKWHDYEFELIVLVKSLMSKKKQRQGAYDVIDAIETVLDAKKLGQESCNPLDMKSTGFTAYTASPAIAQYGMIFEWPWLRGVTQ